MYLSKNDFFLNSLYKCMYKYLTRALILRAFLNLLVNHKNPSLAFNTLFDTRVRIFVLPIPPQLPKIIFFAPLCTSCAQNTVLDVARRPVK